MKCNNPDIKNLLTAYFENELAEKEERVVEEHLSHCSECLRELEEIKAFDKMLLSTPEIDPPQNSELNFKEKISQNKDISKRSMTITLNFSWREIAAAIVIFFAGTTAGLLLRTNSVTESASIANLETEISQMRQMLMAALITKESPSDRLKAVQYAEQINQPSSQVTETLIETLNSDPSVNVRLAAVNALQQFAVHQDIRSAMAASLKEQSDPLIQIVLIKMLVQMHEKSVVPTLQEFEADQQTHEMVKQEAQEALTVLL
ncbi:HEAT repeat domain-containing protein [Marinilabilia rubra]|nr:HEAT repeat domain-containing protein [Marinilabilia rubra]